MYLFAVIVLICFYVTAALDCPYQYAMKLKIDCLKKEVAALKVLNTKGASFTVSHPPDATIVNNQPIKFANIIDNCGNGYNKETGKFTAPISGQYLFSMSFQEGNQWANCYMFKNNNAIGLVQPRDNSVTDTASFTTVLNLSKGDTVWVRFDGGKIIAQYAYFTGGLIHSSSAC